MIFLSHNYKDKPIVEQVARKLSAIYGRDNVFYDSWSIQPGDGIIDKMESGLANCKYFFFFVSVNSLNSNMVKMEWQNALYRAAQSYIKVIPIRMDNCNMPFLLTQTLYIDLFSNGLDVAIRQIVDVINGTNTYKNPMSEFHNLVAIKQKIGDKIRIECTAKYYLEPISEFAFCTQSDPDLIQGKIVSDAFEITKVQKGAKFQNGYSTNILFRGVSRGTLPNFPVVAEFTHRNNEPFDIEAVLHRTTQNLYTPISMEVKN